MKEAHISQYEEENEIKLWRQLQGADGQQRAEILLELAQEAVRGSRGNEALAYAQEAHQIYTSMGANAPNIELANSWMAIGNSYQELNSVDEAADAMGKAIECLKEGNYPFVADTVRIKGHWLAQNQRYEEALECYLEIVRINEIDGDPEFIAKDLLSVTYCFMKMKRWDEVIEHAGRARNYAKIAKHVDDVTWCDMYLADAYAELASAGRGSAEIAVDIAKQAIAMANLRNMAQTKCLAMLALGKASVVRAEFEAAEESLLGARELASSSSDWDTIARIEREFVNLYLVQGRVEAAAEVERRLASLQEIVG